MGICFVWPCCPCVVQVANLWLIIIGGSIINKLDAFADKPTSIVDLLGASVPAKAQVKIINEDLQLKTTMNTRNYSYLVPYYTTGTNRAVRVPDTVPRTGIYAYCWIICGLLICFFRSIVGTILTQYHSKPCMPRVRRTYSRLLSVLYVWCHTWLVRSVCRTQCVLRRTPRIRYRLLSNDDCIA